MRRVIGGEGCSGRRPTGASPVTYMLWAWLFLWVRLRAAAPGPFSRRTELERLGLTRTLVALAVRWSSWPCHGEELGEGVCRVKSTGLERRFSTSGEVARCVGVWERDREWCPTLLPLLLPLPLLVLLEVLWAVLWSLEMAPMEADMGM